MSINQEQNKQKISYKQLLLHDQYMLGKVKDAEQFLKVLETINAHLEGLDIALDEHIHHLLYQVLKPISRQITNSRFEISITLQGTSKSLKNIIRIYVQVFLIKGSLSSLEIIKELLSRGGPLFAKNAQPINEKLQMQEESEAVASIIEEEYKWTKKSISHTKLHRDLCEKVMLELEGVQKKFINMNLNIVIEYLRYLYYLNQFLNNSKLIHLVQTTIQIFEQSFIQPSKDFIKQAEIQFFQKLSQVLLQLLRYNMQQKLKQRVMFLGPKLGVSLLNKPSIQRRIAGVKLLSAFSLHFYLKSNLHLSQTQFSQWLEKQKVFETIFEPNCHLNIIKPAENIFRIYLRKSLLSKSRLITYLQLIDEQVSVQVRRVLFKYLDPFRLGYNLISTIISNYQTLKKPNFYREQFFTLFQGLSRYTVYSQTQKIYQLIYNILNTYYDTFVNNQIKDKCLQCSILFFRKKYTKISSSLNEQLSQACIQHANKFIESPGELKIIYLRNVFAQICHQDYNCMLSVTRRLIQSTFLNSCFDLLEKKVTYSQQLLTFLKNILDKYQIQHSKINFDPKIFRIAVQHQQLFDSLLKLHDCDHLESLLETLVELIDTVKFPFSCITNTFYKINFMYAWEIQRQYYYKKIDYEINTSPENLKSLPVILRLLTNNKSNLVRQQSAELLAQLYTNFTDDFREQGQKIQKQFMQQIIQVIINLYKNHQQQFDSLKGWLSMIEEMMMVTQNMGVGKLKPHNSLIATSTTLIQIQNDLTFGDDVLKVFQRKIPSNTTLFELLIQISRHFKCGPQDIFLKNQDIALQLKYNGLTLEQLQLNGKKLTAYRTYRNRLRKQPLAIDGKVSPKALKVFQQIYNRFAPQGRMTDRQCSHYVEGVTQSSCSIFDNRVKILFDEYDSDKDGNLSLEDFIKFNSQNALSIDKQPILWKNLELLRYRRDLKMYNQPIDDIDEGNLFRFHLQKYDQIYEILFNLVDNSDKQLRQQSIKLLGRLPSFSKIVHQKIQFKQINIFKTQYILIALQNYCSLKNEIQQQNSNAQKFIQSNQYLKIFKLIHEIYQNKQHNQQEHKCMLISIMILRQLIFIQNLSQKQQIIINNNNNLIFKLFLPQTKLFQQMINQIIQNDNMTIFQPLLILQLTQNQISIIKMIKIIFYRDKQIRQIVCNFLYLWQQKKSFSLHLFDILVEKRNCQEWFKLLTVMIQLDPTINVSTIFEQKVKQLPYQEETVEKVSYNPLINGNLRVIQAAIKKKPELCAQQYLSQTLNVLLERTISVVNRKLIYDLLSKVNLISTLDYMEELLDKVKPVGDLAIKVNFVGLKNLGSICYMNSILQQFYMMSQFRSLIENLDIDNQCLIQSEVNGKNIIDNFIYQLKKMYTNLYYSHKKYYIPDQFCLTIKNDQKKPISVIIQQDAHQFLNMMFDQVEHYTNKNENTLKQLDYLFKGKTITQITCLKCNNRITKQEDYYHLSLEVKGYSNLQESFCNFNELQTITDYFCQVCQQKVQKITKQTSLYSNPQYLIINLKRIIFDLETLLKIKVHTKLQFPQQFDIKKFMFSDIDQCTLYRLKGVVIHSGTSQAGHYYSIIKVNNNWYKFNDQSITEFDKKDLPREAFGGADLSQNWGEQDYSTNAYILFYQKLNQSQKKLQKIQNIELNELKTQVQIENVKFYTQIQVHQQSYFQFLNEVYKNHRLQQMNDFLSQYPFQANWTYLPCLNIYQKLYGMYKKVINFIAIFYELKLCTLSTLGENMYQLLYLLPENSRDFLMNLDIENYLQILCTHNDTTIRQIYKSILNKAIYVYLKYFELKDNEDKIKFQQILDKLIEPIGTKLIQDNIFKSYYYFQFWKINIQFDSQLMNYALNKQLLGTLLDFIMGSDSPYYESKIKKQNYPSIQADPIMQMIFRLIIQKKNLNGKILFKKNDGSEYKELTPKQSKILSNMSFYQKMIEGKYDNCILTPVIYHLNYNDESFSKAIVEILLSGLNKIDQIDIAPVILNHIKFLLYLDDEFTSNRLKWYLGMSFCYSGIPQLQDMDNLTYGLKQLYEPYLFYVSSLYFIQIELYQPLLQILYRKKHCFTSFQILGISTLIELMVGSNNVFDYIISIPPPSYQFLSYVDWIPLYIYQLRNQQHYGLQGQQQIYADNLSGLWSKLELKMKDKQIQNFLPIQEYIIGKNQEYTVKNSKFSQYYQITLWAHKTYVLPNKPTGMINNSFKNDDDVLKYFLHSHKKNIMEGNVQSKWMVLTLHIDTKKKLKLQFSLDNFQHQIYLAKGQIKVNCPYTEQAIDDFLKVQVIQQIQPEINIVEFGQAHAPQLLPKQNIDDLYYAQIQCPSCTYINIGQSVCQMCQTSLINARVI